MSFFIVQVQTNYEIKVQKRLHQLFMQRKENIVKSIYALDSYKGFDNNIPGEKELNRFWYFNRIREQLNNMRYAYARISPADQSLRKEYKEQIKLLSKEIKNAPAFKQHKNVLKGYIIIELLGELGTLPASIYYDIKSIPHVIGIPNKYNVPDKEIYHFFENMEQTI
ncbi:hypothetical protein [Cytobacillus horneckiae]|uniref:Uncharacterized protein n=1 Tax=Cytobacillus horneckiae TaxID=549687 RepID=A0A2N0ZAY2_9BACI|nr:hypothetical protein [Cytobacillus horneckiae]MEC1158713.1 hypothetical protein [Cytobacillus horneckiae]NRG48402.1 hypothetical protein [Bacillus sp. CRN 9]PKG26677.1 hypothetical protein CWS20_22785 [Cytobacillus horneckiae]